MQWMPGDERGVVCNFYFYRTLLKCKIYLIVKLYLLYKNNYKLFKDIDLNRENL